jgi:hypothetical protein
MKTRKGILITIFSAVFAFALVGSLALADEFDEAMKLTFGQPVAIPNQVLPPGTYWIVRVDHGDKLPNVLNVYNANRDKVLATLETQPDQIMKASGKVIITFADRSPNQPPMLLDVIYPGRTNGHSFEIVYSEQQKKQLSEFPKITMKVGDKGDMERVQDNAGL